MNARLRAAIEAATGRAPVRAAPLSGGCVGEVYRVELTDGEQVVAKVDVGGAGQLDVEGRMLVDLAPHLPVPAVLSASPEILVMEFVSGGQGSSRAVEVHAAELLATLHGVRADAFGLAYDTLIGGLPQPNPSTAKWVPFFAEHRLVHMARLAHARGRVDVRLVERVETLAGRLDRYLAEPEFPALLHGDVWSGNVLARDGRVQAFLDPAIHFGHPEVELAFITMFSTFGDAFFAAYGERRRIAPGFFAERRDLYNIYPNLVHAALFGGGYVGAVQQVVARYT